MENRRLVMVPDVTDTYTSEMRDTFIRVWQNGKPVLYSRQLNDTKDHTRR